MFFTGLGLRIVVTGGHKKLCQTLPKHFNLFVDPGATVKFTDTELSVIIARTKARIKGVWRQAILKRVL